MKTRFFSLFVALIATMSVFAYDFQSGDLYYNITSDSTVEVTYQEWGSFDNYSELTSVVIPEFVIYNGTTYCVTSIGNGAFYYCRKLTNVVINNSITSISWYAFHDCSSLMSITIPSSVTNIENGAFEGCSNLASIMVANGNVTYDSRDNCNAIIETATQTLIVGCQNTTIPNSVTSIGDYAFSGCSGLASITIPNSVTSIGNSAFEDCSGLTSITIPNSVTSIGNSAFEDCSGLTSITIPNSVTSIGNSAFYGCSGLTSVTIPNSVTSIGDSAFEDCSGLTSVTIPNSVTSIGDSAFEDCSGLTSITIPNSVASIGEWVFRACYSLTSITIPSSVTSIGKEAFYGCSSLTSITIPNSVTSIGDYAFGYVPNIVYSGTATGAPWGARSMNGYVEGYLVYSDSKKTTLLACSSAAKGAISIPNSVTSIEDNAFYGCSSITSVTIPNSVTSIGEGAFEGCSSITSVTIPNSVTSIGSGAFWQVPNIVYSGTATGAPWDARSMNGYVEGYLVYPDATKTTLLACSSAATGSISIPNSVASINSCAFWYCTGITSVTIGNSVTIIWESAFAGCSGLTSVTCYAVEPPTATFAWGYVDSIPLYVPVESIAKYKAADRWENFKILPISAIPADADEPVIDPKSTTVTITWPATDKAATYTIEISKDGALVCTLTFDANGVLQNMRFAAPARHATQHTTQAETTGSGFRFVVEGLDYPTTYTYTITAKDTEDKVVESYNGTFTTTAPTSTEDVHSTPLQPAVRKVFRNGQVLILRGDKTYTLTGEEL